MDPHKSHIVSYRSYALVLLGLLVLTVLTIAVTQIELGVLTTTVAMLIASFKAILVLTYFMHLKFDQRIFRIMAIFVFTVFIAVMIITFLDYMFR